jgi:GNAT superfamily N-acetyltransferase
MVHEDDPPQALTSAGVLHWLRAQPERARARLWVAENEGRVVGWAEARLRWTTKAEGVGDFWGFVAPAARGTGVGRALFECATSHLLEIGACVLETWTCSAAGAALFGSRGFRTRGSERVSMLEPAKVDASLLRAQEKEKAAQGFNLLPLGDVVHRVAELHAVYAAAAADIPDHFHEDDIRLEEWRLETLEHPQLTREGSYVVCAGELPVALAFLEVDEPFALGANELTGTLPDFRRRGLARLAKLASIRWAAEHDLNVIYTANAEANVGMVRLNEGLGYRRVGTETHYVRDE